MICILHGNSLYKRTLLFIFSFDYLWLINIAWLMSVPAARFVVDASLSQDSFRRFGGSFRRFKFYPSFQGFYPRFRTSYPSFRRYYPFGGTIRRFSASFRRFRGSFRRFSDSFRRFRVSFRRFKFYPSFRTVQSFLGSSDEPLRSRVSGQQMFFVRKRSGSRGFSLCESVAAATTTARRWSRRNHHRMNRPASTLINTHSIRFNKHHLYLLKRTQFV